MKEIVKKIAYLRGLCDGYGFDEGTKEGVMLTGILDVLDDMADVIEGVCLCGGYDDEEEEYSYAFICPNCGQELEVDEYILDNEEELTCPACGNKFPVINEFGDFDEEEDK